MKQLGFTDLMAVVAGFIMIIFWLKMYIESRKKVLLLIFVIITISVFWSLFSFGVTFSGIYTYFKNIYLVLK